ncbi:MAG: FecR family protein [Pedobacter sp.]|nr:MAG: FecR family protein [Pedobacter sp.]
MRKQEYLELLDKYEAGLASSEEVRLLHAYYNLFDLRKDGLQDLSEGQRSRLGSEIRGNIDQRILAGTVKGKQVRLWPRNLSRSGIGIAVAAAVAAITLSIWLYNSERGVLKQVQDDVVYNNDIAPGKNTATLTLANGKVIALDTNKSSVVVTDSVKSTTMLTAYTPRGGTYQVVLPDGTHVWLNADSKLDFPSDFSTLKQRIVKLTGEGYFEVAKDQVKPFIVESSGQRVTVLGTHFNVNAYADEAVVRTTLLEGSVNVNGTILSPNHQAINAGNNIQVKAIDPASAIDWKNGEFVSDNENLASIMRKVSRWYNVEVVYDSEELKKRTFDGSLSRYDNVSRILKAIEFAGAVKFKVEGRMITVLKN